MEQILKVENINVYYGAIHAIKGVSIAFREINSGLLEETLGEDDLTEGN